MFNKTFVLGLVGLFMFPAITLAECTRKPRTVNLHDDTPVNIYVSSNQRAAVIFPEPEGLWGGEPEIKDGLSVSISPQVNKIFFSVDSDSYTGMFHVDGKSGDTYNLNLISKKGCADSQVKLIYPVLDENSKKKIANKGRKSLMWHLWKDKLPNGYQEHNYHSIKKEDRLVFEQGSLRLYLQEQWIGNRFVGSIYEVVNTGRLPSRLAIENIDYSHDQVRKSIGRVREVSMNPVSLRLGPAPEFLSEIYSQSHRGLVFVVSEKEKGDGIE